MSEEREEYQYYITEIDEEQAREAIEFAAYSKMLKAVFNLLSGWYTFQTGRPAPKSSDVLK